MNLIWGSEAMKSTRRLVSVIILYYNQPEYIFNAIDSVLEQDYPAIELIIANDKSKEFDEARIIAYINDRKAKNLVQAKVITHKENYGTVKNINVSIEAADGEYIKIFGADDVLADRKVISEQVAYLTRCSHLAVTGKLMQCDENLQPIHDRSVEKNNEMLPTILKMNSKARERYVYRHNLFPYITQALLFCKTFFDIVGKYDENYRLVEDTPMMWKILDANIDVGFLNIYTIKHRNNTGVTAKSVSIMSSQYCNDCIMLLNTKKRRVNNLFVKFDCYGQQKLFAMRNELANARSKKEKIRTYSKNLFYLVSFVIFHPTRTISMVRGLLR